MTNLNARQDQPAMPSLAALGSSWGWLLTFGIVTVLVGIAALAWPGPTILVIAILFGAQLLVNGVYRFIHALTSEADRTLPQILLAVLAIVAGLLVLRAPAGAALLVPIVLGLFWTVSGLIETFHALTSRDVPSRGWTAIVGVLSVVAGVVVLAYPGIGLVTLTYLFGAWLVIYGAVAILRALRMRPHAAPAPTEAGRPAPA